MRDSSVGLRPSCSASSASRIGPLRTAFSSTATRVGVRLGGGARRVGRAQQPRQPPKKRSAAAAPCLRRLPWASAPSSRYLLAGKHLSSARWAQGNWLTMPPGVPEPAKRPARAGPRECPLSSFRSSPYTRRLRGELAELLDPPLRRDRGVLRRRTNKSRWRISTSVRIIAANATPAPISRIVLSRRRSSRWRRRPAGPGSAARRAGDRLGQVRRTRSRSPARARGRRAGPPLRCVRTWALIWLARIVPNAATPVAIPTWRSVELIPEAIPARSGGTTADRGRGERDVDQPGAGAREDEARQEVRPAVRGRQAAHQQQAAGQQREPGRRSGTGSGPWSSAARRSRRPGRSPPVSGRKRRPASIAE